jgi:hypothetical protein
MREVARSALRLPWEMTRLGLEQFEKMLAPDNRDSLLARTRAGVAEAVEAAESGFDDMVFETVKALESMAANGPLPVDSADAKRGVDWTKEAAAWLESLAPGDGSRLALREFGNRLQSFGTFRYVDTLLQIGPDDNRPLAALVGLARGLDPYTAVWAIEGLGHWWAERRPSPEGAGLLADETDLPGDALVALHAGMGLSLARQALALVPTGGDDAAVARALDDFRGRCARAARPGYVEVALEALGLVGRTFYPSLVAAIDRVLLEDDPQLLALFWHGMGRGAYFLPSHFVPGHPGAGRALRLLEDETAHETGRRNALAGLAWPLTLVNIRHPEVVEAALAQHRGLAGAAFADGVGAALVAWRDLTGSDAYNRLWLQYEPYAGDRDLVQSWDTCIVTPCRKAMELYPALKERGTFGELFSHAPLDQLVQQSAP